MTTLEDLLVEWLPQQRWFAAKGRPVASVAVAGRTPLMTGGQPSLDHLLLAVHFADGTPVQHYQLHLARREQIRGDLEHVVIGHLDDGVVYDGLWDTAVTAWLLEAIREGRRVGDVAFVPEPGVELDLSEWHGHALHELTGGVPFPRIGDLPYLLTLPGHGFYWLSITPPEGTP